MAKAHNALKYQDYLWLSMEGLRRYKEDVDSYLMTKSDMPELWQVSGRDEIMMLHVYISILGMSKMGRYGMILALCFMQKIITT